MNLVKYLAGCGMASRRRAEEAVRQGRVSVNGEIVTDPARLVTASDHLLFEGREAHWPEKHHYILLHKPVGYTCSSQDAHAEHLAIELIGLPGVRLVSAGRLDRESEGAILFSDDGEFINRIAHPRYEVLKTYIVTASAPLSAAQLKKMESGIPDGGETLSARSVRFLGKCDYEFILNEGKKREIRRMIAACGAKTLRLKRVSIGSLSLGDLPCGKWRELSPSEIGKLLS